MGDARGQAGHYALKRFFVAPADVDGTTVRFAAAQWHQFRRVLRLSAGDLVLVCDGSGREYVVALGSATSSEGVVVEARAGRAEPMCRVHLFQSALRGDHFTWLLQKATEVGVSAFTPVLFSRAQPADYAGRLDRYRSIVQEAAEQCERSSLPTVEGPLPFDRALERVPEEGRGFALLLDEREDLSSLRSVLHGWFQVDPGRARDCMVSVFVGPEGGLTAAERSAAIAAGISPVGLGRRILRSETAGLVAATLILAAAGDLG
jgi:16S rRNA (uracil1498-N3)-methyltransferase